MGRISRDGIEQFKKLEKDKEIGEDESKKLQSDIEEKLSYKVILKVLNAGSKH